MKIIRKIVKGILIIILIPILYLVISLILTYITIHPEPETSEKEKTIYLSSNGVHAAIVIHKNDMEPELLQGLHSPGDEYFSFGWGDENFYLNTPTWSDLTIKNAITAIFTSSSTLIHLNRYKNLQQDWVKIKVSRDQLKHLNEYIYETFETGKD